MLNIARRVIVLVTLRRQRLILNRSQLSYDCDLILVTELFDKLLRLTSAWFKKNLVSRVSVRRILVIYLVGNNIIH